MNFQYSDATQALQRRLQVFINQHVLPQHREWFNETEHGRFPIALSVYLQYVTFELSFGTNPFNVSPNQFLASHFENTILPPQP